MTTIPYYWNGRNVTDFAQEKDQKQNKTKKNRSNSSVYGKETLTRDAEKPHARFIYNSIQTPESSLALSLSHAH